MAVRCEWHYMLICDEPVVALVECGATIFNSTKQEPLGYRSARHMCAKHRRALRGKFREVSATEAMRGERERIKRWPRQFG